MGQPHSTAQNSPELPITISKNFTFKNHQDYQFVKQINRINAPTNNIYLFNNKTDKKHYTLRIIVLSMEEELAGLQKIIEKRKKIKSLHLCNLKQSTTQEESMTCATIHRLALLIQCPPKSLKQQFQIRKTTLCERKPDYFKQSQLWAIAYSVIHGLKQLSSYGVHHQSLDLQQIYVQKNGLIKLGDPILFGLQKNYMAALRQKQVCGRKLSPQLINFLQECNFFFYEKEHSDVFILGLILLEATLLKEVNIYNFMTKQKNFGLIKTCLRQVKGKYTQKYNQLLSWMLEIQPKNRPKYIDLVDFIQTNNVETSSSNDSSKHIPSNQISPIGSQIQFKQLPIEGVLQNRTNKQIFYQKNTAESISRNNQSTFAGNNIYGHHSYGVNSNHNLQNQNNASYPILIKQSPLQTTPHKAGSQHNSDVVFPFQLVYNRIVNNNQNLKPFELPKLYQQYRVQMFNSSCRGSVPSSSFHQKKLESSNQNMKNRDIQTFSQKYGTDQFQYLTKNYKNGTDLAKNSKHQSCQASERHQTNLIYSNSSGLNSSNRVYSSAKTLGDIKLIQSNHYINQYNPIEAKITKLNQMQGIVQESVASSPYRKLDSVKSKSNFQNQSGNYNNVFSSVKLPEYNHKNQKPEGIQDLRKNYNNNFGYKQQYSNFNQRDKKKVLQELQFQYHSMETKKHTNTNDKSNLESFKSQLLYKSKQTKNEIVETVQIKEHRFANFQNFTMFNFQDEVISSKNQLLEQSQMNSKLSVFTPNFYQKDRSKNSNDFLQNSKIQNLQYVQGQASIQGNIYTGFKSKNGLKQGNGKLYFHDGGYYDGQWKNNQMNGYGQMYYQNGQVAYKGSWKNDHFCGSGKVYNDRPQQFTDQFDYKDFSQIGQKWLSYQGQFDSDSKHGKGRIDLTNGQYFQGTFDYDMIEGYGTYYTKDQNKVIRGIWHDNQLVQTI